MQNPATNFLFVCITVLAMLVAASGCERASSAERPVEEAHVRTGIPVSNRQPVPGIHNVLVDSFQVDKKLSKCPACGKRKPNDQELCDACNDEVANTCYRCGAFELNLDGKLCSHCRLYYCALCNKRKQSRDNDLCYKCHNAIEMKGKK